MGQRRGGMRTEGVLVEWNWRVQVQHLKSSTILEQVDLYDLQNIFALSKYKV